MLFEDQQVGADTSDPGREEAYPAEDLRQDLPPLRGRMGSDTFADATLYDRVHSFDLSVRSRVVGRNGPLGDSRGPTIPRKLALELAAAICPNGRRQAIAAHDLFVEEGSHAVRTDCS